MPRTLDVLSGVLTVEEHAAGPEVVAEALPKEPPKPMSLVELLVIIAVLSGLIALMWPALGLTIVW